MWVFKRMVERDFFTSASQIQGKGKKLYNLQAHKLLNCVNRFCLANVAAWNVMHSLLPWSLYYTVSLPIAPVLI
jgi:hypothetical protein